MRKIFPIILLLSLCLLFLQPVSAGIGIGIGIGGHDNPVRGGIIFESEDRYDGRYLPLPQLIICIKSHGEVEADLLVTDYKGRKVGYDPQINEEYDKILNAEYDRLGEWETDLETGEVIEHMRRLTLDTVNDEEYILQVIGTGKRPFDITVYSIDVEGKVERKTAVALTNDLNKMYLYKMKFEGKKDSRLEIIGID